MKFNTVPYSSRPPPIKIEIILKKVHLLYESIVSMHLKRMFLLTFLEVHPTVDKMAKNTKHHEEHSHISTEVIFRERLAIRPLKYSGT